ncbi:MAG: cold shock domain-containing protein [Usitatibacteraceae bacterium]
MSFTTMRFQGRITEWKADRGFGFITPNGGGAKVFLHFRSLQRGEPRPSGNELVTYELIAAAGKGPRAENVAYVDRDRAIPSRKTRDVKDEYVARRRGKSGVGTLVSVVLVCAIAAFGWQKYSTLRDAHRFGSSSTSQSEPLADRVVPVSASNMFSCEGKTTCTQMTSCEEAKFYLKNCPGVTIDGDGNGIPCERQWCK